VARRVELLPRAQRELGELPVPLQDQIIAKLDLLRDFPELGAAMVDAFEGYRALLAVRRTYRIIYRILSADVVEVAYIRHCRRQASLRLIRGR
jgi:plasmid stabilization system protein ParE